LWAEAVADEADVYLAARSALCLTAIERLRSPP